MNIYKKKGIARLAVVLFLFSCFQGTAQDYWPGELYFNIKADAELNLELDTPELKPDFFNNVLGTKFFADYKIEYVKAPFYFTKTDILRRTFRVKISDPNQIRLLLQSLNVHPSIEYAEQVPIDRRCLTPNDLGANSSSGTGQWSLHKIQAQNAWNTTTGSTSIVVAIVDDAIMTTHTDLAGQFVAGRDVSDNDNNTNPAYDYFPHGTHVAGIAGAATNNGTGMASIGYNVRIMPVKASPDSAPSEAACNYNCVNIYNGYSGITWAADHGADVINMSWGGTGSSTTNANVIADAWNKGAILVASAGNKNNNVLRYPASYNNVISVAATNSNDQKSSFSSYGAAVDVSAPGESIYSTVISGNYERWNGTSMASPMVAGLCGLVWSANTSLSQQDVVDCVINSTDNIEALNSAYTGQLGSGRVNAHSAVVCATSGSCPANLSFSNPINSSADYEASDNIQASSSVAANASVDFDAGNSVFWNPGFLAMPNIGFHVQAFIDGCDGQFRKGNGGSNDEVIASSFNNNYAEENQSAGREKKTKSQNIQQGRYGIKVYPNPFNDNVKMDISGAAKSEGIVALFGINGNLLLEKTIGQGASSVSLNTDHLHPGIFVLKVRIGEEVFTRKLVK